MSLRFVLLLFQGRALFLISRCILHQLRGVDYSRILNLLFSLIIFIDLKGRDFLLDFSRRTLFNVLGLLKIQMR